MCCDVPAGALVSVNISQLCRHVPGSQPTDVIDEVLNLGSTDGGLEGDAHWELVNYSDYDMYSDLGLC